MLVKKVEINEDESFQSNEIGEKQLGTFPKNYCFISYENRIQLIEDVCVLKKQIIQVAASLGIKLSTAKYILRSFRKKGKVLKKIEGFEGNTQELSEKLISLKAKIREINKAKSLKKKMATTNKIKELRKEENFEELMMTDKSEKTSENQIANERNGFDFSSSLQNLEEKFEWQQQAEQNNNQVLFCYCYNPLWAGLTTMEYYLI